MISSSNPKIPVLVAGALGKMGSEVVRAVCESSDCELVGAIDNSPQKEGIDIQEIIKLSESPDFTGTVLEVDNYEKNEKVVIINKYYTTEGKINTIIKILSSLNYSSDKIQEENLKILNKIKLI